MALLGLDVVGPAILPLSGCQQALWSELSVLWSCIESVIFSYQLSTALVGLPSPSWSSGGSSAWLAIPLWSMLVTKMRDSQGWTLGLGDHGRKWELVALWLLDHHKKALKTSHEVGPGSLEITWYVQGIPSLCYSALQGASAMNYKGLPNPLVITFTCPFTLSSLSPKHILSLHPIDFISEICSLLYIPRFVI